MSTVVTKVAKIMRSIVKNKSKTLKIIAYNSILLPICYIKEKVGYVMRIMEVECSRHRILLTCVVNKKL